MASYTKGQRAALDKVERLIVHNHRAGLCDGDGNSVTVDGRMVAKPRGGRVTFRKVYPRYK